MAAGVGIVLSFLQSCKAVAYIPHVIEGEKMVVKKSDLAEHPYVVIQPAGLPAPVYLCRLENGEYSFSLHEENNEKPLAQGMFTVSGPRTRIGFTLAPRKLSVLNVRLRK